MTHLVNDPANFTDDMLEGFAELYADYVIKVPGGVVRATTSPANKVAVVVGGGSGHYPAFCGVVGPGFADGAVVGNIFTSPSAQDAYNVGVAASNGAGVLFITGNYAGDVMNFNQAQARMIAEGYQVRNLYVTDDVASASVSEIQKRRGIAGDFTVFKVASAAAEAGLPLDEVERLAIKANDYTRTLGVAFAGCTLPGAAHPLFNVADGQMGLGLGIHGEPGIADELLPTAAQLAETLVNGVLGELQAVGPRRIAVILNGLGATKYEEMFVTWGTVSRLLKQAGFTIVDPEVGELVTSLDMAGCSLTVMLLDDELEPLWRAAANTPAYRKGAAQGQGGSRRTVVTTESAHVHLAASPESQAAAKRAVALIEHVHNMIVAAEQQLGDIDAVAGDGDHGRGMVKGTSAALDGARAVVADSGGLGSLFVGAGEEWAAKAGGTSGVLWGNALRAAGQAMDDSATAYSDEQLAHAIVSGIRSIQTLGRAQLGDKTMLDSMLPFAESLEADIANGLTLVAALRRAVDLATVAARDTASLKPKVGRARPLAEKSLGTPDAGATSFAMIAAAAAEFMGV
ncbi:MAG: dihydroxyacetone kinase family protein [Candidatus Nanopelagicales bacterium]